MGLESVLLYFIIGGIIGGLGAGLLLTEEGQSK